MIRYTEPAGWYGDNLPTGERVALIPNMEGVRTGHILVSSFANPARRIELPETGPGVLGPRFLRMSNEPSQGFQMAGQGDQSRGTWHYKGERWNLDPRISHGESAHIFDRNGKLHIIEPAANQTSQGYRYEDEAGNLILGDNAILFDDLSQPCRFGNITIGQGRGPQGGVAVHRGAERRLIAPGLTWFIRVRKLGDKFSVAWVAQGATCFVWFSESEISSFPLEYPPVTVPDPIVVPPMAYKAQAPDITNLLRKVAEDNPEAWAEAYEYKDHPRTDRFVKLAAKAAHKFDKRFGMNGKRGGSSISMDALAFKNPTVPERLGGVEIRDFIIDSGTPTDNPKHGFGWIDNTIISSPKNPDGVKGRWIQPETDDDEEGDVNPPTHKYNGGGNDTGKCDSCGKSRFDSVHAIPMSKIKHVYDGGEQDTGLCDICQKAVGDSIHDFVVPDPIPDPDPDPIPDPEPVPGPVPTLAQVWEYVKKLEAKVDGPRHGTFTPDKA